MPRSARESSLDAAVSGARTSLGLVSYCFERAKRHHKLLPDVPDFSEPDVFIAEAARLGASAVQISFGIREAPYIRQVRELAQAKGVALEGIISLPENPDDVARFEAEIRTARELGISVVRTVMLPGRRYEQFHSTREFSEAQVAGWKRVRRAEGIASRFGIKLALENHKDQLTEERLALLEGFSSEYLGSCLDIGNNIALLENPLDTARAFAPWTLTVHFKDQAVRPYEGGFLLADIAAGDGGIDLAEVVRIVREKKPSVIFHLELITRDALEIPVLKDHYWITLRGCKAPELAAALAFVNDRSSPDLFPVISKMPPDQQVALERSNIERSLRYARDTLGFTV